VAGKDFNYTVTGKFSDDLQSIIIDSGGLLVRLFQIIKETPLEITLRPFYKKRTDAQNRYIWGVAVVEVMAFLKETTGEIHTKDAVYAYLRTKVLGQQPVLETIQGEEVIVIKGKHFSQMSTVEFSEAVDKIVAYFEPLGCIIHLPKGNNTLTDFIKDE
jgi:hypothetical protein